MCRQNVVDKGLTVISGCMFSGKTGAFLEMLDTAERSGQKVIAFKPGIDNRFGEDLIGSHSGLRRNAIQIDKADEIWDHLDVGTNIVAIDEVQFLPVSTASVCRELVARGCNVVVDGLNLDFKAEPFGPMQELLVYADNRVTVYAVCKVCGSVYATRTQRLIDGKPARKDSPLVMVGAEEAYEARCLECYKPAL